MNLTLEPGEAKAVLSERSIINARKELLDWVQRERDLNRVPEALINRVMDCAINMKIWMIEKGIPIELISIRDHVLLKRATGINCSSCKWPVPLCKCGDIDTNLEREITEALNDLDKERLQ